MWFAFLFTLMQGDIRVEAGYATAYWPGDGHCGKTRADGNPFRVKDDHVAHRSLPLGTRGVICNLRTRRCVKTAVRDRGPYGALRPCHRPPSKAKRFRRIRWKRRCWYWDVQIKLKRGWRRRGTFDVTRPVMKALRMRAFDRLIFVYGKKHRRRPSANTAKAVLYAYRNFRW